MWTDGQTDMTGLIVGFGNFANAPKIVLYSSEYPKDSYEEPPSCTQKQYSDTCTSVGKLRPAATPAKARGWSFSVRSAAGTRN
jgi:hypothetical protein